MSSETASPQLKFDQAIKLLAEKKTVEGSELLRELKNEGHTSAGLESNLGRAFVELGDYGQGIPLLMNAITIERFSSIHRNNLDFAQKKVANSWGTPMNHPVELASRISSYIRSEECFALSSLLFLILIWMKLLKKQYVQSTQQLILFSLPVLFFLGLGIFSMRGTQIIIVNAPTELRSAPLESAESTMALPPGTRVRALRYSGNFVEIERSGNFRGWVNKTATTSALY